MGSLVSKATQTDAQRIFRSRALFASLLSLAQQRGIVLFVFGVVALFVLGSGQVAELQKRGFANNIDENAMLPGQSSVYFAAADVRAVALDALAPRKRAAQIELELRRAGLDAATQVVSVSKNNITEVFYNVYGIARAPRAPGTESILLSAPWICMDGELNTNGFNYLFSLAAYIPKFSHWSKDVIFLFSDGGLIGTRAWLEAYHGAGDTFHPDVKASPILYHGGVIEEALNLEFPASPHNTYDSLGVYTQGLNGQQPNADIPMVVATAAGTFGIPIRLHRSHSEFGTRVVAWIESLGLGAAVVKPVENIVSLLEYMGIQALGIPMSHHALFPKYKIEGVTVVGVRNPGNHYGAIDAQRVCLTVESTFRSFSSLLERLHHSYWFYLMFGMYEYLPIAFYIGPIVLLSVNLVFEAFIFYMEGEYVLNVKELTSETDKETGFLIRPLGISSFMKAPRPLQLPIAVISVCYAVCWTAYSVAWSNIEYLSQQPLTNLLLFTFLSQLLLSLLILPLLRIIIPPPTPTTPSAPPQWKLLKSLCYSLLAMTLLTVSSLNPSLSALLALPVVPLAYICASPSENLGVKVLKLVGLQLASPVGLLGGMVVVMGEEGARGVVEAVAGTGYWLEGWSVEVLVCGVWPVVLALQVLVGGF
ncbi:Glycosyl phosphatidyl inositol protein transamidase complex subunit [Podochytrium sp. JEL0797]|nr:Glycosyl phosphatidyl inositol protein transamidase complex subunit [Podochytrium sp. JEL0797]